MTVDKRTSRSQLFKMRQLPRPQFICRDALPRSISCDDIPQPIFNFTNGDPALNDLWELLRSVYVSASVMQSPLAPTIRHALLKLDQAAINTTCAMMEMLKFQLPPHTSTPTSIPVPPVEPTISSDIPPASPLFADDVISSIIAQLDDLSATLSSVEPQWRDWGHSLTAQVDSLSSFYEQQFSSQFAALDAELDRLNADNTKLTAEVSRLHTAASVRASPTKIPARLQDTFVPTQLFTSPARPAHYSCGYGGDFPRQSCLFEYLEGQGGRTTT